MLAPLLLAGCVSEQRYDQLQTAYNQLQSRYTAGEEHVQLLEGRLKITMTDRILFSSGGYRINERARETLAKMIPTLQGLQNTRIIVEGYTDTTPVGAELRREGISTNLDLSSRRADTVADTLDPPGGAAQPGLRHSVARRTRSRRMTRRPGGRRIVASK